MVRVHSGERRGDRRCARGARRRRLTHRHVVALFDLRTRQMWILVRQIWFVCRELWIVGRQDAGLGGLTLECALRARL